MKILYAIQATGNGHISRANTLIPQLSKLGTVDTFLSGSNSSLKPQFPVNYKSNGLSLFYDHTGGLDYQKILKKNRFFKCISEALQLPIEDYDLIINDFEPITSLACKLKKKYSIQVSHQASFLSKYTPRPKSKERIGESILNYYSTSNDKIGFHFKRYDDFILGPIIKDQILNADPRDFGHITVYLPGFGESTLQTTLHSLAANTFECFVPNRKSIEIIKNIKLLPTDNSLFTQSMIQSHGLIIGAGFETPSEALFLEKKILSIPLKAHYEQLCNAAALENMGQPVIYPNKVKNLTSIISDWLRLEKTPAPITPTSSSVLANKILEKFENHRASELSFSTFSELDYPSEVTF
ncbi:MAG: glycosyltransferase family protein [Saprospiraceae bacterium]